MIHLESVMGKGVSLALYDLEIRKKEACFDREYDGDVNNECHTLMLL